MRMSRSTPSAGSADRRPRGPAAWRQGASPLPRELCGPRSFQSPLQQPASHIPCGSAPQRTIDPEVAPQSAVVTSGHASAFAASTASPRRLWSPIAADRLLPAAGGAPLASEEQEVEPPEPVASTSCRFSWEEQGKLLRLRGLLLRCSGELTTLRSLVLRDGGAACGLPQLKEAHRSRLAGHTYSLEDARDDFCNNKLLDKLKRYIAFVDGALVDNLEGEAWERVDARGDLVPVTEVGWPHLWAAAPPSPAKGAEGRTTSPYSCASSAGRRRPTSPTRAPLPTFRPFRD